MSDSLTIRDGIAIPMTEIAVRASRSSGPGGQHANVTASRIEVSFDIAESDSLSDAQKARAMARLGRRVTAVAQDARSQTRNRELALQRLATRLAHALEVPKHRTKTRPTAASRRRRAEDKTRRSQTKRGRSRRFDDAD
jgi:ribosome-associated protein